MVATVKRNLQLLLPGVRVFLDVDDLESIDALEAYVAESAAVLVLLGSTRYFTSDNCRREVAAASEGAKPLVLLHDADGKKHGGPLEELKRACSEEDRAFVFGAGHAERPVIPWHRVRDFQLVSLRQIAEQVVRASPAYEGVPVALYLPGDRSLTFRHRVGLWVSEANEGAREVAEELAHTFPRVALVDAPAYLREAEADGDGNDTMLVYLNAKTFASCASEGSPSSQLADELRRVLRRMAVQRETASRGCTRIVLVHECEGARGACAFDQILAATPMHLKEGGLYKPLAIGLHGGEHRDVSRRQLGLALGGQPRSRMSACSWLERTWVSLSVVVARGRLGQRHSVGDSVELGDTGLLELVRSGRMIGASERA